MPRIVLTQFGSNCKKFIISCRRALGAILASYAIAVPTPLGIVVASYAIAVPYSAQDWQRLALNARLCSGQLQWAAIASHSRINKPRPPGDSCMAAGMVAWRMAPINRLVR